jgi:hypothetical protein
MLPPGFREGTCSMTTKPRPSRLITPRRSALNDCSSQTCTWMLRSRWDSKSDRSTLGCDRRVDRRGRTGRIDHPELEGPLGLRRWPPNGARHRRPLTGFAVGGLTGNAVFVPGSAGRKSVNLNAPAFSNRFVDYDDRQHDAQRMADALQACQLPSSRVWPAPTAACDT